MKAVTKDEAFQWLDYIKTLCGNSHDESKAYLIESRLSPIALKSNVETWSEFLSKVKLDTSGTLKRQVIDAITTHETSFFRDTAVFELLKHKIVPDLIDKRKKNALPGSTIPLRLWSAACSNGQEVYSVMITIHELLGTTKGFDIRILGTDISDAAVSAASYGVYSRIEIERGMTKELLGKYFKPEKDAYKVKDEIRAFAHFKTLNLLSPLSFPHKFDIILCRNVAIYFSEPDRKQLYNRIASVLSQDGYLIIGSTESLTGLCPQFESKRYLRSIFYQFTQKNAVSA